MQYYLHVVLPGISKAMGPEMLKVLPLHGISKSAYYIDSPTFIVYKTFILVQLHSSSVVTKKLDVEPLPGSWRHDDVSELPE